MEEENDIILLTASYDSTIKFWATTQPNWECKKTVDIPKDVKMNARDHPRFSNFEDRDK